MQLRYAQMLAALRQSQEFLSSNEGALGDVNAGGARAAYDEVIRNFGALAEEQGAYDTMRTGELRNERRLARELRRQHMKPIVKVARAKVPAAAQLDALTVPPERSNSTSLAAAARSMAIAVRPYAKLLQEGGMPADFQERLNAAIDALEKAVAAKGAHLRRRIGATDGISDEVQDARRQVDVMDAMVRATLPEGDPLITEWKSLTTTIRSAATRAVKTPDAGTPAAGTPGAPASGAVTQASAAAPGSVGGVHAA